MAYYYVNDRPREGHYEVHEQGCYWLGIADETTFLGSFSSCQGAVEKAIWLGYHEVDGCKRCSPQCHTR